MQISGLLSCTYAETWAQTFVLACTQMPKLTNTHTRVFTLSLSLSNSFSHTLSQNKQKYFIYIPSSSNLHLGNHLRSKEDGDDCVYGKCDVDQIVADFEGLWCIHAHWDHADKGTKSQQATHLKRPYHIVLYWTGTKCKTMPTLIAALLNPLLHITYTKPAHSMAVWCGKCVGGHLVAYHLCFQPSLLANNTACSIPKRRAEYISLSIPVHNLSKASPMYRLLHGGRCYKVPWGPNTESARVTSMQPNSRTGGREENSQWLWKWKRTYRTCMSQAWGICLGNSIKIKLWQSQQSAEPGIKDHCWCSQIHTNPGHGHTDRPGESRRQKKHRSTFESCESFQETWKPSNTQKNVWTHEMQTKVN